MSNKKKILFRADAAPHIGIGDLMSLIHLSRYLDDSWEVFFVIKNYEAGVSLCKKYGIEAEVLDENILIEDEVKFLNKYIDKNKIDIIFFEITERKLTDYKEILGSVKKACVSFDGKILDDMSLVVDWDTEALKFHNPDKYPNTKFLLGHRYVVLPKEFYEIDYSSIDRINPPKKLLIAMGGADEFNFSKKVVEALIDLNLDLKITVVVGSGYERRVELEELLSGSQYEYKILVNISSMLDEYLKCDAAIGAGGLTVSELVATNTPSCIIATYQHQIHRCKTFNEMGYIDYLGFKTINKESLKNFINKCPLKINLNTFTTKEIVNELEKI